MFIKYPEKGRVKSRLILEGYDGLAADLYHCFIDDLLERVSTGNYKFLIAYDPPGKEKEFIKTFGEDFFYVPQQGENLGIRMFQAFAGCFNNGFQYAVIIGSDCPDIPQSIIEEAFRSLNEHDAVIGPACDGGYYLIGFTGNSIRKRFFENIEWSTDNVFRETMQRFHECGVKVHVLPVRRDIDKADDIYVLIEESKYSDFAKSKTIKFLKENGIAAAR